MVVRNLINQMDIANRKVQEAQTEANATTDQALKDAFTLIAAEYQRRADVVKASAYASFTTLTQPA